MNRRTALAAGIATALVVLAGGAAVAANAGLLTTDDSEPAGQLSPADPDGDGVTTVVVESTTEPTATTATPDLRGDGTPEDGPGTLDVRGDDTPEDDHDDVGDDHDDADDDHDDADDDHDDADDDHDDADDDHDDGRDDDD